MVEIHCTITGDVQNVGFRDYVQRSADALLVVGWVRNRTDESVELIAQGNPDALKEFIEHLHEGSLHAIVEGMSVDWRTAKNVYDDFAIRHD
ncbi:MAG: acylphosphatase [Candidatus Paceibacterota bacterium]